MNFIFFRKDVFLKYIFLSDIVVLASNIFLEEKIKLKNQLHLEV